MDSRSATLPPFAVTVALSAQVLRCFLLSLRINRKLQVACSAIIFGLRVLESLDYRSAAFSGNAQKQWQGPDNVVPDVISSIAKSREIIVGARILWITIITD